MASSSGPQVELVELSANACVEAAIAITEASMNMLLFIWTVLLLIFVFATLAKDAIQSIILSYCMTTSEIDLWLRS